MKFGSFFHRYIQKQFYKDTFGFGISIAHCLGVTFFMDTVYIRADVRLTDKLDYEKANVDCI